MRKLLIPVLLFALSGCASMPGVIVKDGEAEACKAEGCTVWTERELTDLIRRAFTEGYQRGSADGARSL